MELLPTLEQLRMRDEATELMAAAAAGTITLHDIKPNEVGPETAGVASRILRGEPMGTNTITL